MSLAEDHVGLTDEQITAYIDDPATIPTHEIALEVYECLDNEIASIQTQIDAAMIEANVRPLSEERQGWAKRASYACAMKRNQRHKVYQRDKELRGMKGRAFIEPKHSKEEKQLKQQRLLLEAETRREVKRTAGQEATNRAAEIAQQRRELASRQMFQHKFYEAATRLLSEDQIATIKAEAGLAVSRPASNSEAK